MNKGTRITKAVATVLAIASLGMSAPPIQKTGACPTFTRSNSYLGITLTDGVPSGESYSFSTKGWAVKSPLASSGMIQNPLTPEQSVNCVQVPPGLKAEILASELTPGNGAPMAYPMNFTFDERGRMWVVEPRDYPYTHDTTTGMPNIAGWNASSNNNGLPTNRLTGKGRILIFEDVDGDGAMDNFKVFYVGLALPTSIELVKGGVIVTVPPNVYFIPSVNDVAGTPQIVVSGMGSNTNNYDAHGQTNSLTYGLDNYVYGHVGYNGCGSPVVGTNPGVTCGGGNIYRFKATAIGSDTNQFQIVSNNGPSNSHGIGQTEDGQWFKSGATGSSHDNHQVRFGQGAVDIRYSTGTGTTANSRLFSLTNDRWMWEGNNDAVGSYFSTGSSAVSGSDFYTARLLPTKYWSRYQFACEGASRMCNMDSLSESGSTWRSNRLLPPGKIPNIFASTDSWTAPIKVKTGPDGALWVLDWYNYLFLHNPAGPSTDAAWRNPLRAKSLSRFYRILPDDGHKDPVLNLTNATNDQLVATLSSTNFVWRMMAQKQLLWKTYTTPEKDALLTQLQAILTTHKSVDTVGIDGPVIHALWTLHGMKEFQNNPSRWNPILKDLLLHPAWGVRRNVVLAMPRTAASAEAIKTQCAANDVHAHVRVQVLDALAAMPAASSPVEVVASFHNLDTHSQAAFTAAGASKVVEVAGTARPNTCPAYQSTVAIFKSNQTAEPRHDLRMTLTHNGFELLPYGQLASGTLTVYDLRGQVAFQSTYNNATSQWSQTSAKGLNLPVYFYSFHGINGDKIDGRITLASEL